MTTNPTRDRLEIPDVLDEMIGDTLCDVQTLREQVRKYLNEAHRAGYREGAAAVSAAVGDLWDRETNKGLAFVSPRIVPELRAAIDPDAARRHDAQVRAQAEQRVITAFRESAPDWDPTYGVPEFVEQVAARFDPETAR